MLAGIQVFLSLDWTRGQINTDFVWEWKMAAFLVFWVLMQLGFRLTESQCLWAPFYLSILLGHSFKGMIPLLGSLQNQLEKFIVIHVKAVTRPQASHRCSQHCTENFPTGMRRRCTLNGCSIWTRSLTLFVKGSVDWVQRWVSVSERMLWGLS